MRELKINELEAVEFSGEILDNCFFVKDIFTSEMKAVPMRSVFEWIKKQAAAEGLAIKLMDENIIFVKHEK